MGYEKGCHRLAPGHPSAFIRNNKNQCRCFCVYCVLVEYIFVAWHCDNAQFVMADKVGDFVAFYRRFHVVFYAPQCVEHRCVALVNVPVGLGNVIDDFVGEPFGSHDVGVNAIIADGVVRHDDEGWYIAIHTAAALYHGPFAHFAARVQHHRRAKNDTCANFAVV